MARVNSILVVVSMLSEQNDNHGSLRPVRVCARARVCVCVCACCVCVCVCVSERVSEQRTLVVSDQLIGWLVE